MSEARLLEQWRIVADDLGIEVVGPFRLDLASGIAIQVPVLVRRFGGVNGMLLLSDYSLIKGHDEEVVRAGFGYSVLSEPDLGDDYDREEFIEMLVDWGWSGPESERPAWLTAVPPGTN